MEAKDYNNLSGGMADLESDFSDTSGEYVTNLDITQESNLQQRHGSVVLDDTASLIATTAGGVREDLRNGSFFNYQEDLHPILRGINKLYAKNEASYQAATAWTKIPSPNTGWEALPAPSALTAATVVSGALWAGQQLLVGKDSSSGTDNFITPQKVFLDDSNMWRVRNASIPSPSDPFGFVNYSKILKQCIVLANLIGDKLEAHILDDELHWEVVPLGAPSLTSAISTEEELIEKTVTLITVYNQHINDALNPSLGNAHGRDTGLVRTQNLFSYKPALCYLMSDYVRPTSAFECAPLLNKLMFAFNLHYVSFYGANPASFSLHDAAVTFDNTTDEFFLSSVENSSVLRIGDPIFFKAIGGSLPAGLSNYTNYFVTTGTTSTLGKYGIAASFADALAGTRIDFTTNGSGTLRGFAGPLNLHRGTLSFADTVGYVYIYPEGFNVVDNSSTLEGPPHFSSYWYTDIADMFNTFKSHIENATAHTATSARGFLLNGAQFNASTSADYSTSSDWQVYAGVMKAHHAYVMHRKPDNSTEVFHIQNSTDSSDTETTLNYPDYIIENVVPNPFDTSTWESIYNLYKDFADNFSNTSGTVHYTYNYAGVRHVGTAPSPRTRVFNVDFAQKRYALLAKSEYLLYNKNKVEVVSAPNIGDSYCIVYSLEILSQQFINSGAYVDLGLLGDTVILKHYLTDFLVGDLPRLPEYENLDTDNITIEVYETTNGGTNLLLTATYKNSDTATSQVLDNSDLDLSDLSIELYTTGGVVPYDPLPPSTSVVRVNDFGFYGNIAEESAATLLDVTFTTGTPGIVNRTAHGFTSNKEVVFWNLLGVLPGAITMGKIYYVRNPAANTFEIAEQPNGSSIAIPVLGVAGVDSVGSKNLSALPKRLRQSFPGILTTSPESFFVDVETDIVFVGRAQEYPIVVGKQGVYRIEGVFSETGQGGMVAQKISDRIGGVSANCGITVNDILYFMGLDGFYRTNGFQVEPISLHLKTRHLTIADQDLNTFSSRNSQVQCTYDRFRNIIYWSVNDSGGNYPNQLWALHVTKGTENRGSFTVYNNTTQFAPTAVGYFRGNLIRGDYQGFWFKHNSSYKNDPKINRASTGSLVTSVSTFIPYLFRTMADNFGSDSIRKRVFKVFSMFNNLGNLTTAIGSINDRYPTGEKSLKGVRFRGEYEGFIKESRTFPAATTADASFQGTRCHHKQVSYAPDSSAILYSSDDYAVADKGAGTVTLTSVSWPTPDGSLIDLSIYFDIDDYATGYAISAITSPTELAIASGGLVVPNCKWVIKGTAKDEKFSLRGLILYLDKLLQQPMPPSGDSGANS